VSASFPLAPIGRDGRMGMVGVDKIGEIRRAYFEQERTIKEVVRTLSVSRRWFARSFAATRPSSSNTRDVQPTPKLGVWVETLTRRSWRRNPS
jgi:hypothetical protein